MNSFTKAISVTAIILSSIGLASASNVMIPADNYVTTKLCLVASEGSKTRLSKAIKNSGLSKHYLTQSVKCNELNLVNFIEQYGSNVEQINNFLTNGKYSNHAVVANLASR